MNKSLIALAVLGAFAGVASAQSSVTIGGTVDLAARNVSNSGRGSVQSLSSNGLSSSALRFLGTEDLGGGLKAGFWLESALFADNGTVDTTRFWGRRSTVSLIGGFGEVRLGRDYTPTFWNMTVFDPFGTNGVGSSTNPAVYSGQTTHTRADNSIGYFLPAMGGIYGQIMAAAGEGNTAAKYVGGRLGFAAGPFNVAAAYGKQYAATASFPAGVLAGTGQYKTWNIGGSYDLGVAKLMAQYNKDEFDNNRGSKRYLLGASVPMGQGTINASYVRVDQEASSNDATQIALGYQYALSKRTTIYGTASRLDNKGALALSIPGHTSNPTAGGNSTGLEVGVRHTF
ncbi:MAG: porin [Burkholderiaceae bacterium]